MHRKIWTTEEVLKLKELYPKTEITELERVFERPWELIKTKARKIPVYRASVYESYPVKEIIADYITLKDRKRVQEKYNISSGALYTILARNNIKTYRPEVTIPCSDEKFTQDYKTIRILDMAEKYKISEWAVRNKVKQLNLGESEFKRKQKPAIPTFTSEQLADIKQKYVVEGVLGQDLAKLYNVKEGRIYKTIRDNGWALSKEDRVKRQSVAMVKARKYDLPAIKEKTKQTNLLRYGVENPMQNKEVRQKVINTTMEKYGVPCSLQNAEVMEKIREACIEKYGSFPPKGLYGKTPNEIKEWLNTATGLEFKPDYTILDGKEIDLYNDETKIGIEYCGLYWHNENSPEPRGHSYHFSKYTKAKEKGVHLITMFEDEWLGHKTQVKGVLLSILHKNSRRLYARECEVKTIDRETGNAFYEEHHIHGKATFGKYYAGLYYKDELVGVMSFGLHHRDVSKYTLDRLCFKYDVSVAGGAQRLFKHLLKTSGITELLSWSDNRWFQGQVYEKLGFIKDEEMKPDYSYVNINSRRTERISKQSQKKSNVDCPSDMTEYEWCKTRGLYRIWDCGKTRWKYTVNLLTNP